MTEQHKEEKLLRAIATPPVELPEGSEVDESAEWAAVQPLEPALRERLRAAVRAELAKDAAPKPEATPQRAQGQMATSVSAGTMPTSPRYRAPAQRWWRPRIWFAAVGIVAAVVMAILIGPWRDVASIPKYALVIDHPSDVLGSSPSPSGRGTRRQEIEELPLEDSLSAELQTTEAVPQVPEVKVWVEQQGKLWSWPVSVELQSRIGSVAVVLKADRALADLSSAGAKVSVGPATVLVAMGVPGKLPSDSDMAAWVGKEVPDSRSWHLIRREVKVVMGDEGQ